MFLHLHRIGLGILTSIALASFSFADAPGKGADSQVKQATDAPPQEVKTVPPGVERKPGQVQGIPRRDPNADAKLIDLSNYYTLGLHEDSTGRYGYSLNMIQRGVRHIGNADYDIRGIVQASSSEYAQRNILFPTQIVGIKVGQTCRTLCFLHASRWTEDKGTEIGSYIVHYANGQKHEIPIRFGIDLRDWDPGHDPGAADAAAASGAPPIVWRGNDKANQFVLYEKQWQNPLPDVQIESIDLVSSMTTAAPFLVGLTAK